MSTRQLRLQDKQKITEKLQTCSGKKIQIVLNDQTVLFATVVRLEAQKLIVSNMRLTEVVVPIDEISEVYVDAKE